MTTAEDIDNETTVVVPDAKGVMRCGSFQIEVLTKGEAKHLCVASHRRTLARRMAIAAGGRHRAPDRYIFDDGSSLIMTHPPHAKAP